tara:strand:+ start:7761 stop:8693 length:933 start_codon:yes stop_codon:yes gene_type:complete
MKFIRAVEEEIAHRYHEKKMRCPTHLCTGQEAVSASLALLLKKNDYAMGSHRSHGHYLAKGGNLNKMISEIYGKENGCSKGYGGSMHLIDLDVNFMGSTAIVGNSLPLAAGLALALKLDKKKNISCIFLGEGCVEEGVFYETVNFCAQKKIPTLFICENNLYSVYSPLSVRQPKGRSISSMVEKIGVKSFNANGNNVEECYNILSNQINKIRKDGLPRFVEFSTYRWREHCGPNFDNDIGYRKLSEFNYWKNKDPIINFEKKLLKNKELSKIMIKEIDYKISKKIISAFKFAEKSKFPSHKNAFKNVFAK